ncbi:glycerophosphodiester phosphodiesterase family protein [Sphingomonas sp. BN140010]|uniref:Glycerophosphodiester phosphodiesterase family protein n=1 Tax=Sphingomonas arvum TaxID=2992113 RepID=A0ABT3JF30_9SPHN|nr:glycerophosphodiester phosphodiesterase family protein [Sphingomonas sp. BN140010]MCW3797664.1 glycerophosphodiester phosphodiesterase family protein [Sphingomonas sp. BN140010]
MRSFRSAPDPLNPGRVGFAHRGLHGPGVPENSLASGRAALAIGAGIECDVRLSADGVPMVFHDADLMRLCGIEGDTAQLTAAALTQLTLLGTAEHVPTLAEWLAPVPVDTPALIEVKATSEERTAALCAAVAALLGTERPRTAVMSFAPAVSCWFAAHSPERRRGLVVDGRWPADFRESAVAMAEPQFVAIDKALLGDPWTAAMRERVPVYSWTIQSPEDLRRVANHADAPIWEGDGRP